MHLTKRHAAVVATLASVLILPTARGFAQDDGNNYQPVASFDPQRNPFGDLREAMTEAGQTQRRIMLEVGSQSCAGCNNLDQLFASNLTLKDLRDRNSGSRSTSAARTRTSNSSRYILRSSIIRTSLCSPRTVTSSTRRTRSPLKRPKATTRTA